MKIYINGRYLTQELTGVQRFSYEITNELVKNSIYDVIVLIPKKQKIKSNYRINFKIEYVGFLKGHLWEQISLPLFLLKRNKSLLLNFSNSAPIFYFNKFITVHDLSIFYNHFWFNFFYYNYYKLLLPMIVRTTKKIITVSKFSKNQIVQKFKIDEDMINVVYNGVSKSFNFDKNFEKQNNSILFVGSLNKRKNLNIIVEVVTKLENLTLNIVGVNQNDFIEHYPQHKSNDRIKCFGNIYGKKLAELYKSSLFYINPSYYEGFGLPIIEAFSSGCIVLVSNIEVFHEICLDAAVYFNPNNSNDLINKINELIDNKDLCQKLINLGKIRSNLFVWKEESKKIIKLIDNI